MDSLRLPARESSLPELMRLAQDCAERAGLDELAVQRVELVLEEALANIIHHAYPHSEADAPAAAGGDAPPGTPGTTPRACDVALDCAVEPGELTLTITDWGPPFDPVRPTEHDVDLAANLEADLDSRAPGGLGLILIRSMSQATYRREQEANVLTLRFPHQGCDC